MDSDEEVDWIGIAAAVELEEAEAEAAAAEEAAAVAGAVPSAPRSTNRKRPHDSDDQQMTMSPSVCLAILLLALASPSPASANIPSISNNNGVAVAAPSVPTATQFLQAHNDARREVGVAPLEWNSTLEQDAKRYADRLGIGCKLEPLDIELIYLQNTYQGSGYQDGAAVTASWVNGRRWYDYRANACAPGQECGAYKLVVCNTTQELGCARSTCRSSPDTVAVCSYFPDCDYNDRPY